MEFEPYCHTKTLRVANKRNCRQCKKEFFIRRDGAGVFYCCVDCRSLWKSEDNKKNAKKYREENREKIRLYGKKFYHENIEKRRKQRNESYQRHREKNLKKEKAMKDPGEEPYEKPRDLMAQRDESLGK